MKILIANRGEIARRIARTARRLGHDVIGITTVLDDGAVHAAELDAVVVDSYLDGESILAVAREHSADAVHPGYGFLAENAEFARSLGRRRRADVDRSAAGRHRPDGFEDQRPRDRRGGRRPGDPRLRRVTA